LGTSNPSASGDGARRSWKIDGRQIDGAEGHASVDGFDPASAAAPFEGKSTGGHRALDVGRHASDLDSTVETDAHAAKLGAGEHPTTEHTR
jgi:hypothetical protein